MDSRLSVCPSVYHAWASPAGAAVPSNQVLKKALYWRLQYIYHNVTVVNCLSSCYLLPPRRLAPSSVSSQPAGLLVQLAPGG